MIGARWEVEVRDRDGRLLSRDSFPARSFVANLARMLKGLLSAPGTAVGSDTGVKASATVRGLNGTNVTVWTEWYGGNYVSSTPMAFNAPSNNDSFGIVVGSGTESFAIDDYNLISKISHGTGSGQLVYGPTTIVDIVIDTSVSPPVARFNVVRSFENQSGSSVTVAEVGLIGRSHWSDNRGTNLDIKYLIARDVLSQPVVVPDGGSLTVTLTVEVVLG